MDGAGSPAGRNWLERAEEALIALLLALMTLITFGQVIARYVFNYSFVWALELVIFLFGGLIFLGMAYGARVGAHIGVDALVRNLAPGTARVVAIGAALLCLVYAAIVVAGSWVYVGKMYEIGILAQDIPVPQWVPRSVMPLGFGLLFLHYLQVLIRLLTGKDARLLGDEVEEALRHRSDGGTAPSGRP